VQLHPHGQGRCHRSCHAILSSSRLHLHGQTLPGSFTVKFRAGRGLRSLHLHLLQARGGGLISTNDASALAGGAQAGAWWDGRLQCSAAAGAGAGCCMSAACALCYMACLDEVVRAGAPAAARLPVPPPPPHPTSPCWHAR
jgi:hypothetical protein